jgi:hypothetical protein
MEHQQITFKLLLLSLLCKPIESQTAIQTFPLLPHHHVVSRHLRENPSSATSSTSFDRQPHAHRRTPQNQQLAPLYQGYGTHYIDLWIGYPPQRQTAVVDTGSAVTAFPCSSCLSCGSHTDPPYDESRSQSFRISPCVGSQGRPCLFGECDVTSRPDGECQISHQYGTGDDISGWKAYEAQDVAYAGGIHDAPLEYLDNPQTIDGNDPNYAGEFSFALTFGCQTSVSGYFEKQLASGVVGLDRRAQSFWGQMRSQQVIHRAVFGLCFVRQPAASRKGTLAGAVSLGGAEERLNLTPMVFAKTVTQEGGPSYKVRVRKMYLRENGGTSVMYDGKAKYHALELEEEELNGDGQLDIDSGTTDTYFTKAIGREFTRVWREITKTDYTNDPISLSEDQVRKLPTVMLQLVPHEGGVGDEVTFDNPAEINGLAGKIDYGTPNDVMFAIPAVHYMQHNADGTYTARIYLDREDAAGSILGANAMMGHNLLFDIDSGRVGIAESECDYAALVAEAMGTPARSEVSGQASTVGEPTPAVHEICGSLKCKGFMGITCTVFFLLFFIFARRYVTKRDDIYESDVEMKSSRSSNGRGGGYSDDEDSHGGSRGGYRDNRGPPTSYSDDQRRSGSNERGSRHHGSNNSHSSHRLGDDGRGRISGDRSQQSTRSQQSSRSSHQSMSGSIQSHHSSRSQRSHQSAQSHRTSSSHRSSGERSSHSRGSHGSGGSGRSHRSGSSHRSSRSDRYYEGERGSSRRDRYYDDDDDEISRPPSIS